MLYYDVISATRGRFLSLKINKSHVLLITLNDYTSVNRFLQAVLWQSTSVGYLVLPKTKMEKIGGQVKELWPLLYLDPQNFLKINNFTFN